MLTLPFRFAYPLLMRSDNRARAAASVERSGVAPLDNLGQGLGRRVSGQYDNRTEWRT